MKNKSIIKHKRAIFYLDTPNIKPFRKKNIKISDINIKLSDIPIKNLKFPNCNPIIKGLRVPRFYKGKWQYKRHYRFKDKPENIVAVVHDLLIRNGIEISKDLDYDLGQAYLMEEGKIKGFLPKSLIKKDLS